MVDKTEICNAALLKIGANSASLNIETDDTVEANLCNTAYDRLLEEILREHSWNFAIKRAALAKLTTIPLYEFTGEFQLPTDLLKILSVENDIDYRIEGKKLLTNSDTINIKYSSLVTDTAQFDSSFVDAFASRIAWEITISITNNQNLAQRIRETYELALERAKRNDSGEDVDQPIDDSTWVNSRFSSVTPTGFLTIDTTPQ